MEASGYAENNHLGCETWLYIQNPIIAKTPNGSIVKCYIDKYVILIASPRILLILCSFKVGMLAILNVHGPDTSKSAKEVYDCWNDLQIQVDKVIPKSILLVLATDADARVGNTLSNNVGAFGAERTNITGRVFSPSFYLIIICGPPPLSPTPHLIPHKIVTLGYITMEKLFETILYVFLSLLKLLL